MSKKSGKNRQKVNPRPPITPAPFSLPLQETDNFLWKNFENFSLEFIRKLPNVIEVNKYGTQGENQQGIDIIAKLEGGIVHVFQCKQVKSFSEADFKKLHNQLTYKADKYHLLLACEASTKIRDYADHLGTNWAVWDKNDITQKIRDLDKLAAKDLVLRHFGNGWSDQIFPEPTRNRLLFIKHLPNGYFTGRAETLLNLPQLINDNHIVAIIGLGGIGKSQLALKYSYDNQEKYNVICWIRASNTTSLLTDYRQVANLLGIDCSNVDDQSMSFMFNSWFDVNDNWLLVYDDADSPQKLVSILPKTLNGHILITSRFSEWESQAKALPISVLSENDSVSFLLKRTGKTETEIARQLANVLGFLPLALGQCGAYIAETKISLQAYLDKFRAYSKELLSINKLAPSYTETVASTWRISFEQLESESPNAILLLQLCAFLDSNNIPRFLFEAGSTQLPDSLKIEIKSPVGLDLLIGHLVKYSLVEANDTSITVHKLVQSVIRDKLSAEEKTRLINHLAGAIRVTFHSIYEESEISNKVQDLIPHAIAILENWNNDLDKISVLDLNAYVGSYLHDKGRLNDAIPYLETAVKLAENLAIDLRLRIKTNLGICLSKNGDFDEAEVLFLEVLEESESNFGANHKNLVAPLNSISNFYNRKHDHLKSHYYAVRAKSILDYNNITDGIDFADTLNGLAGIELQLGIGDTDIESAYKAAAKAYKAELGDKHITTFTLLCNLSDYYMTADRVPEAESILKKVRDDFCQVYGPEHPEIAFIYIQLGLAALKQGRTKEALRNFHTAKDAISSANTDQKFLTSDILINIGTAHNERKEYSLAEEYLVKGRELAIEAYGSDNLKIAQVDHQLTITYFESKKFELAEFYSDSVMSIILKDPKISLLRQYKSCFVNRYEILRKRGKFGPAEEVKKQMASLIRDVGRAEY